MLKVAPWSIETKVSEAAKVTITKVFDFAGEEVRYATEPSLHFSFTAWVYIVI